MYKSINFVSEEFLSKVRFGKKIGKNMKNWNV